MLFCGTGFPITGNHRIRNGVYVLCCMLCSIFFFWFPIQKTGCSFRNVELFCGTGFPITGNHRNRDGVFVLRCMLFSICLWFSILKTGCSFKFWTKRLPNQKSEFLYDKLRGPRQLAHFSGCVRVERESHHFQWHYWKWLASSNPTLTVVVLLSIFVYGNEVISCKWESWMGFKPT